MKGKKATRVIIDEPAFRPVDPGMNRRRPKTQDERIEQALSDFVEALLAGSASIEVRVLSGVQGNGWAIRLRKD